MVETPLKDIKVGDLLSDNFDDTFELVTIILDYRSVNIIEIYSVTVNDKLIPIAPDYELDSLFAEGEPSDTINWNIVRRDVFIDFDLGI